jgi:UDP-N-acetylmuramate--alanine ligase
MQKTYHFIGIGGIGVGTLAALVLAQGHRVSGSDIKENGMIQDLRQKGAQIFIGHKKENISEADFVVYSSAVAADNPELLEAQRRGIVILRRAQLLAELMADRFAITVAGAHGKTTTTSMISNILIKAGLNPSTAIGGILKGTHSYNPALGRGKYFVAEVDESDGSFLYFKPRYSVITNIDYEHVDFYRTWDNILAAYDKFMEHTEWDGLIVACGEDERLKDLLKHVPRRYLTYGLHKDYDIYSENIRRQGLTSKFDVFYRGKPLGTIQLLVPGRHNVLNALAATAVGLNLGIDFGLIQESFLFFQGVNRRFQIKARIDEVIVVDDYGHHPTEIAATLATAQSLKKEGVIVVFQPHRYSRTKFLFNDFVRVLASAEELIITDIYAASEPPIDGVSTAELCQRIREQGNKEVTYLKKEDIVAHLLRMVRPGDMVLTLGAGDITRIGDDFVRELEQRRDASLTTGVKTQ